MPMIDDFLRSMQMRKGSDLHVMAGDPPRMRVHGDLITLDNRKLNGDELAQALQGIMTPQALDHFQRNLPVSQLDGELCQALGRVHHRT